jgi:tetratricopeptide (TPR) repeat protein
MAMSRLPAIVLSVTLLLTFSASAQETRPAGVQQTSTAPVTDATGANAPEQNAELRADILMARKMYPDAIAIYQTLLIKEPKNAVMLNKVGIAYQQEGDANRAERFYKQSVKADRANASALNNLGTIQYGKKKYRKAIRLYKQALDYRSDMPTLYSNLGYAYFAEKKFDDAMSVFQKALALDPEIFAHHGGFGTVVQQRSVEDYPKFYFLVAKAYALAGNVEQCAHYLKMARDEGYKDLDSVRKDPAFSKVLDDPRIEEVLQTSTAEAITTKNPQRP